MCICRQVGSSHEGRAHATSHNTYMYSIIVSMDLLTVT